MLKTITSLIVLILFLSIELSFAGPRGRHVELKNIDGSEVMKNKYPTSTPTNYIRNDNYAPVYLEGLGTPIEFHPTGVFSIYDLQSNAVPNQIWQDPLVPMNVHAVFMWSITPGFSPRRCSYLFSQDGGETWLDLGEVPAGVQSGFVSVSGLSTGAAVLANHNNSNGTGTHAKIYVDLGAGIGAFTEYDPGNTTEGEPIWPRVLGAGATNIVFAASINGADFSYTNTLALPGGTFGGYATFPGDQAETYSLALAANGNIGHAFIGSDGVSPNDAFFRESSDGGVTWSTPTQIWNWDINTDSIGVLRGISMIYLNNAPFVSFNTMPLTDAGFFPGAPSEIRVWSPGINGGVPVIIADQNDIPFFPNTGIVADAFTPICRPAIGRSSDNNCLFVGLSATTEFIGEDSSNYYAAWLVSSLDAGNSWMNPERLTPVTPTNRDWRYISMSPSNEVSGGEVHLQMTCQVDSVAGSHVNGAPQGWAQLIGIHADVPVGIVNISSIIPSKHSLYQNFPNPFNPSTSIRFDITKSTNVTLKVYDVNGREIATLANNEAVTPGTKEVRFDASNYSTGIYFYTLYAGDFKETKKMMLIK